MRDGARRGERLGQDAAAKSADLARQMRRLDVPWARSAPARAIGAALLVFGLGPPIAYYVRTRRRGHERFAQLTGPVVLVANHSSHLDTPAILRALPAAWRRRTVVAAAADHFYQRRSVASGVSLLFNTVPVSRAGGGADALEHIQELVADGWNLLIYAEGTRSRDGAIGQMHSGAALVAQRHQIPIVPVRVTGTHAAMPPSASWPQPGQGAPAQPPPSGRDRLRRAGRTAGRRDAGTADGPRQRVLHDQRGRHAARQHPARRSCSRPTTRTKRTPYARKPRLSRAFMSAPERIRTSDLRFRRTAVGPFQEDRQT